MNILVTGATGFIGRHLVLRLLEAGHTVTATSRTHEKARQMPWYESVKYTPFDIHSDPHRDMPLDSTPDILIHLAWSDLSNYNDISHFELSLPGSYRFIKKIVKTGTKHVLVAGTCLEYGPQCGPLSETQVTCPVTAYGIAKDTLRKFLEILQKDYAFTLQWVRLFYLYGEGQHPNSLFGQLDKAIVDRETSFNMSAGDQLRDYLPVEDVVLRMRLLAENRTTDGIINCCNGKPRSIRRLVEDYINQKNAHIRLNLGYYPYPDYEPMAFWGNSTKLSSIMTTNQKYNTEE